MSKQKPIREYSDLYGNDEKPVAIRERKRQSFIPEHTGFFRGARISSHKTQTRS